MLTQFQLIALQVVTYSGNSRTSHLRRLLVLPAPVQAGMSFVNDFSQFGLNLEITQSLMRRYDMDREYGSGRLINFSLTNIATSALSEVMNFFIDSRLTSSVNVDRVIAILRNNHALYQQIFDENVMNIDEIL